MKFTRMECDKIIRKVCKVGLECLDKSEESETYKKEWKNVLEDRAIISGHTITLGLFKNEQKRLLTFFHEVGHMAITAKYGNLIKWKPVVIEMQCWQNGIELAASMGVHFDTKTLLWGYERALTYKK